MSPKEARSTISEKSIIFSPCCESRMMWLDDAREGNERLRCFRSSFSLGVKNVLSWAFIRLATIGNYWHLLATFWQ
jgi:hypothetical protein